MTGNGAENLSRQLRSQSNGLLRLDTFVHIHHMPRALNVRVTKTLKIKVKIVAQFQVKSETVSARDPGFSSSYQEISGELSTISDVACDSLCKAPASLLLASSLPNLFNQALQS